MVERRAREGNPLGDWSPRTREHARDFPRGNSLGHTLGIEGSSRGNSPTCSVHTKTHPLREFPGVLFRSVIRCLTGPLLPRGRSHKGFYLRAVASEIIPPYGLIRLDFEDKISLFPHGKSGKAQLTSYLRVSLRASGASRTDHLRDFPRVLFSIKDFSPTGFPSRALSLAHTSERAF